MVDSDWIRSDEKKVPKTCIKNPLYCKDGFTMSIWEKNAFDAQVLSEVGGVKKYLVSSGADFDRNKGYAYPGFAIYRQVKSFSMHLSS